MPKTKKTLQVKNLDKFEVYITDTTSNSDYFRITNLPSVFTGGRNSFLVGGSPFLKAGSIIQIEIVDAKGIAIFQNPVAGYIEANSRLISVEINENTAVGYATIIMTGIATSTIDGTPIPPQWQDRYNVRWSKRVLVEPNSINTSPIKFIRTPAVFSEEKRFLNIGNKSFVTASDYITASLEPILNSRLVDGYIISAIAPTTFSADYYGGILTGSLIVNGESASLYLPITDIMSSTTAFSSGYTIKTETNKLIDKLYLVSGSYETTVLGANGSVTSSAQILYGKLQVDDVNIPISYAKLRVVNLNTVSGEVAKSRIYSKVSTNYSDYKLIGNVNIITTDLLTTASNRGELSIGNFYTTPTASTNWHSDILYNVSNAVYLISGSDPYYNSTSSIADYTLTVDDGTLLTSMQANVPITASSPLTIRSGLTSSVFSSVSSSGYFIGTKVPTVLFPTTEYTLKLDAYYKNYSESAFLTGIKPQVDIYIIGTGSAVIDNNPLGQKIGSLVVVNGASTQRYQAQEFNFTPALSQADPVLLRFVITNGFWNFSNISLKPASDRLFAPDEVTLLIPNTEYFNEFLQHKLEFFGVNNNSTEVTSTSLPTFFTGSVMDLGVIP